MTAPAASQPLAAAARGGRGLDRLELQLLGAVGLALASLTAVAVLIVRATPGFAWVGPFGLAVGFVVIAGASCVAIFVLVSAARTALHQRLEAMREAARELGGGDLAVLVPEGRDDLGSLGVSLNAMSARVARLLSAQRDLLSGVSHELRSPLARISVALELIEMGRSADDAELTSLVEGIREEVSLLEHHISRLLEAQRVSSKRVLLRRRPLALDALVERVVDRERLRLAQLGWQLELELGAGRAELLGDQNALDRVVSTLIENAIQHAGIDLAAEVDPAGAPPPPTLRVETSADSAGLVVRVCDRGPGLTDAQCAAAFEPFFRIDSSRSTRTGGTGLGLYLARTICEAHGGTAVARPRPGGGLIVELCLQPRGQADHKETLRVALDTRTLAKHAAAAADLQGSPPSRDASVGLGQEAGSLAERSADDVLPGPLPVAAAGRVPTMIEHRLPEHK
jgi:signal transduction histidine kinase